MKWRHGTLQGCTEVSLLRHQASLAAAASGIRTTGCMPPGSCMAPPHHPAKGRLRASLAAIPASHLLVGPLAPPHLCSIRAWTHELPNVRPPLLLDASRPASWQVAAGTCRAVFAANLTHISPWAATEGLVGGAGRVLAHGGELFM